MKTIRSEMTKLFILSGVSFLILLFVLYKSVTYFIMQEELQKARLLSDTLLYTREYIAKMVFHGGFEKQFHTFATTPAYAVSQIAATIRKNNDIYVKQVSDRFLSKKDKPNPAELRAIQYLKSHPEAKEFFELHSKDKAENHSHLFYVYPLRIQKSCLECHGTKEQVPPKIYKEISKLYGTNAFGYKIGELRGIISIKIPFAEIEKNIKQIFIKLSLIFLILYIAVIYLFIKLNKLIINDIEKIQDYLTNNLAKNIYKPFKEEMTFEGFEEIKEDLNNVVKSLKNHKRESYKHLYYNHLTNLPNRRKLLETLEKIKAPIILIDMDGFKEVNYYYGEELANKLIIEVANRLKKDNKIFHIKIDEFAILTSNPDISKDDTFNLAKSLIEELEKPYNIDGYSIVVKFRAGISWSKKSFVAALSALDATRMLNKNIVFCSEAKDLREAYKEHLIWIKKLTSALENNRIVAFYQPIVDENKNICKYEALVRMIDKENVISPFFFLNVAKKSRLYFNITKIMITEIVEKIKEKNVTISMNLSTLDMQNDEVKEFIIDKIKSCPNPEKIHFEIVESDDIKTSKEAFEFIQTLKKLGCKILIDDFGSGYANFDYLLSLGADAVKIDGSLIKNILNDKNSQVVVKTIISFAKEVNMQVIAEFVENDEIFNYLKEKGVDCYQGYFYSPPKENL